jgi:acyl dehydratase
LVLRSQAGSCLQATWNGCKQTGDEEQMMTGPNERLVPGWNGRYYEDFTVGDVYRHPLGRTITATDNIWLTLLTQNTAPLHFDAH